MKLQYTDIWSVFGATMLLFMGLPWNAEVKNNCLQCMMRWDGPSSKCDTVCQHEWKHVVVYLPKRQHR